MEPIGVYIHIPFCKKACSYCDFHFSTGLLGLDAMVEAIAKELAVKLKNNKRPLSSLYFGGGSPSLLSERHLATLMNEIGKFATFTANPEITLEANPDDIHSNALAAWFKIGFNRLSVGIQSFNEPALRYMNRAHTAVEAYKALHLIKESGFEQFSIDLIYGVPLNEIKDWEKDLDMIALFAPPHLSCYSLTVEENTPLYHQIRRGISIAPQDEHALLQFDQLIDWAKDHGYLHYEISNFSKPGFHAVHNRNYWKGRDYIGIGPSAHEKLGNIRRENVAHNRKYMLAVNQGTTWYTEETIGIKSAYNEWILTSLRAFLPIHEIMAKEKFGESLALHFEKSKRNLSFEWIQIDSQGLTLTREGMRFADRVALVLFI
jgi:oxygen-independent coproporphyrinogen-3 oxidase